jgi:hypothetical protein
MSGVFEFQIVRACVRAYQIMMAITFTFKIVCIDYFCDYDGRFVYVSVYNGLYVYVSDYDGYYLFVSDYDSLYVSTSDYDGRRVCISDYDGRCVYVSDYDGTCVTFQNMISVVFEHKIVKACVLHRL